MNKRKASELAKSETLTIGQLRAMIDARRGAGGFSVVNPTIPLEQVLDIYSAAIDGRDDAEVPKAWRHDPYRPGRMKPTMDAMIVTNILRDAS